MTNENAGRTKGSYRMSVSLAGGQSVDSPFCHFVMGRKNELKALGMTERCTNTNSRTQDEDRCRRMIDIERNTKKENHKTWHLPIEWLFFFRRELSSCPFVMIERAGAGRAKP